ncbi:MAG: hypothetical protein AB7U82_28195 [Blastocatellales bacterium]
MIFNPTEFITTPGVSYVYDNQALPGGAPAGFNRGFALGRMVAVNYGSGSAGNRYGYDEDGRAVNKTQQINGANYATSASYNRSDLMTSGNYPSTRTVSYGYDSACRGRASAARWAMARCAPTRR